MSTWSHRAALSCEKWAWQRISLPFFQDSSGPPCVPRLAWCISSATMGKHILVIFLWPLEEKGHKLKNFVNWAEISRTWAKAVQRKAKNLRADLKLWWLTAGLCSFGSGAQRMPGCPPSHAATSVGPWQDSDLTHWLTVMAEPAAVWLGESQIIKLPVKGLT